MINPSYAVEQGITIPLCLIFSFISSYQLFLAYRHKQAFAKRNIHSVLVLQPLFCLPHESDPWSLHGRVPLWASRLTLDFGVLCGATGISLIIYSHFQAHYTTIYRTPPRPLLYSLAATVGVFWVSIIINDIGVYSFGYIHAAIIGTYGAVQFLAVTAITDFLGFRLIYRLMIDLASKKEMPTKYESENTFALLLRKIKRFHGFLLTALVAAFLYYTYSAIKQSLGGVRLTAPSNPEDYELSGPLPAVLATWLVYTWWAWIPREALDDGRGSSGKRSTPGSTPATSTTHTTTSSPTSTPAPTYRVLTRALEWGRGGASAGRSGGGESATIPGTPAQHSIVEHSDLGEGSSLILLPSAATTSMINLDESGRGTGIHVSMLARHEEVDEEEDAEEEKIHKQRLISSNSLAMSSSQPSIGGEGGDHSGKVSRHTTVEMGVMAPYQYRRAGTISGYGDGSNRASPEPSMIMEQSGHPPGDSGQISSGHPFITTANSSAAATPEPSVIGNLDGSGRHTPIPITEEESSKKIFNPHLFGDVAEGESEGNSDYS